MKILHALVATVGAVAVTAAPCDIYGAGGTPCVAAHSVVRAGQRPKPQMGIGNQHFEPTVSPDAQTLPPY